LFPVHALDGPREDFLEAVQRLGYRRSDFQTQLFDVNHENDIVLLDFWTDSEVAIYRHRKLGFRIPFVAPYHFPLKPEDDATKLPPDFVAEGAATVHPAVAAINALRDEYEFEGIIGEEAFKSNLTRIISNISPNAKIFILLANETWLNPGNGLTYAYPAHSALNRWVTDVTPRFANVVTVDVRQSFSSEADAETVNHFDRLVYYRISQKVLELAAQHSSSG